ncbi:MAG TPA: ABC transporter substrate-binding protein, partial [Candidatus Binatia bacterium]|nr:ABC transporter substrate-binding protein [Candidatus Binatia bacterium]
MILRRAVIVIALLQVFFLAAVARAQTRLGILVPEMGRSQSQAIKGLNEELKRLGYREKTNLFFETRNVKGNRAALRTAAGELLARRVSAIFTTGTSATRAAMAATSDLPIVFVYPGDPAPAELVKSGGERAKNLTGVAAYANQATERRLSLFKEIYPELRKVVIFYDANNAFSREQLGIVERSAKNLDCQLVGYGIKSTDELKTTLGGLRGESGMGIFQIADDLFESESEFVFETARRKKLPTLFNEESWAVGGAMAAYGPNYLEMGRLAARLI